MSRTITSNMISFADLTDARQIDISIASNLPETQIYDQNEKKYSPDWSINPLILTPTVYMGPTNVSNPSSPSTTTYTWYRKYGGTGTEEQVSTNRVLTINANLSNSSGIVTYRCLATYKANSSDTGVTSTKQIVFTRVTTGLNGSDGTPASVTAQYSSTGLNGSWHDDLRNGDAYIRFSYDNGSNWTSAWKIKGEDGTGVELKGTAYINQTLPDNPIGTKVDKLFSNATKTNEINKSGLLDGDSYFVEGYLFTYSTTEQKFTCVGRIQGPPGIDGIPSYTHIKYADDDHGTNMGDAPIATTKWIGIKSTSSSVKPSAYTDYAWSKYVGEDAKSIVINASSQVFKIGSNNSTPVPATITVTGIASNTNITSWGYNTNGGNDFYPIVNVSGVAINGNQITITGKQLQSNAITFRATDGTNSDTLTIYKVADGAIGTPGNPGQPSSIAFLSNEHISFAANANGQISGQKVYINVIAYTGNTKVLPTINTELGITGLPTGMTIGTIETTEDNELKIPISITNNANLGSTGSINGELNIPILSPVQTVLKLIWSKINTGATGAARYLHIRYSNDGTTFTANNGQTVGAYMGQQVSTSSTASTNFNSYTWAKIQGSEGKGIGSIVEHYAVSSSNTTAPTSWQTTVPTMTVNNKYLWNYETITYTDNSTFDTDKIVIGVYGNTGDKGDSILIASTSVTYQAGTSGTTKPTGTWSTTVPSVSEGAYLWTKTVVSYSDGKSTEAYGVSYNGRGGTSVTVSSTSVTYQVSSSGTSTPTGTWNSTIPSVAEGQFLWTRTIVNYSDGKSTTSYSVSYQGRKGDTGNGISSIVNYYLATDSSTGVTTSTSGWTTTIQTTTASRRYLWNYEVINYTNGTKNTSATRIIGTHGTNAVVFQIYAPNGYLLSSDLTSLTLQTSAYDGSTAITSGTTYKWYEWVNNAWSVISGATSASLNVSQSDVLNSKTYKCEMTYKGVVYIATETVEDKGDTYNAMICTVSSDIISSANRFLIVYVLTYNHSGEVDALLGPISRVAPANPVSGDYWYSIDVSAETVTLKKYNGTAWVDSTDLQELTYDWNIGGVGKVKVIKKSDISVATNLQCEVVSDTLDVIARCNQLLYDTNDPIVSDTEPSEKFDGQIWIKKYDNGTFSMYTWSAADNQWIMSENDSRQKIFTKKPSNYQMGDLWLVGSDYAPSGFTTGALLKAQNANLTYSDSNWVDETMYARRLAELSGSVERYNQFFDFTAENGLKIRARDSNNNPSKFYTQLTNSELGFYQDNDKVAYINDHKMNITEADINIVATPMLKIGNFAFIVESNGSMSIVRNQ